MDALYLYPGPGEDALWIRMELMDRSLADVLELVDEGVLLEESVVGRVAADVSVFIVFILVFGVVRNVQGWLTRMCRS